MATEYKLSYTATEIDEKLGKIDDLATKSEVPTKTSDLTNDSGFLTSYAETDPTVPAWAKATTKPTYTASEVGAASIEQVELLSEEKVNKSGLTLGVHTDGLVYIFVDGSPNGNGLEIKADVVEGDVFGYVGENNVILLNGSIPDGTYTIKYEMEDGSTIDIGELELDNNVYYSVTCNLTNCANSNSITSIVSGSSYSATITANDGYELSSIAVTMDGTDITSAAVSGSTISIPNVTGNIVITAVATETVVEIINQIPISTNADGSLFVGTNGEAGYKTNTRLASTGTEKTQSGIETTGFIPVTYNDTLYLKGITITTATTEGTAFYNANHELIVHGYTNAIFGTTSGEVISKKISDIALDAIQNNKDSIAFIRISANEIDANSMITVNQAIS